MRSVAPERFVNSIRTGTDEPSATASRSATARTRTIFVATTAVRAFARRSRNAGPSSAGTPSISAWLTVASAVFLKLCSETLEELRTRFAKHNGIAEYELLYDYVVE